MKCLVLREWRKGSRIGLKILGLYDVRVRIPLPALKRLQQLFKEIDLENLNF